LAIVLAIAAWGILIGVAVGLGLAIILFAVSYSRTNLVRLEATASTLRSNVERGPEERRILHELGDRVQILKLQGFVFFGTANSLFERIRARALDPALPQLSFILLDFRRVTGLDSSAALSFEKVAQLAKVAGFRLVYTSVPVTIQAQLEVDGAREDEAAITFAPDVDRGLQLCEDWLLEQSERTVAQHPPLLEELFGTGALDFDRLAAYIDIVEVPEGTVVIRQGDAADAIYLLDEGRLTVQLDTAGGDVIRIRTLDRGTVVGEIAMYLGGRRTASVVADEPCRLLRLTSDALERLEREEPGLAAELHKGFARAMAERLSDSLRLIEALLD
jgi:SulP family sulfate permease